MGELGANQLCSFDPIAAEVYASVSSDNRLRLWNTVRPADVSVTGLTAKRSRAPFVAASCPQSQKLTVPLRKRVGGFALGQ